VCSWVGRTRYRPAQLAHVWLLAIAVLPQVLAFYFPPVANPLPDRLASLSLVVSQIGLLIVVGLNLSRPGFWLLGLGLVSNLSVILANRGWMPISPELASQLLSNSYAGAYVLGARLGWSKDIVLAASNTHLWWLSDRFLMPAWVPMRVAFSLGDVLVSLGVFWLLWTGGKPDVKNSVRPVMLPNQIPNKENTCDSI
jgi:hypothetical protein